VPSILEYSLDPIEKRVYKLTFDHAADPTTYTEVDLGLHIESLKK
jgi:Cdc6-like AAA superfamily ATPase